MINVQYLAFDTNPLGVIFNNKTNIKHWRTSFTAITITSMNYVLVNDFSPMAQIGIYWQTEFPTTAA